MGANGGIPTYLVRNGLQTTAAKNQVAEPGGATPGPTTIHHGVTALVRFTK